MIHMFTLGKASYKVQKTKSEFYADVIAVDSHQPKNLWKVLNDMSSRGKSKSKSGNIGLVIEDKMCFDKWQVACHFNTFFTTVAASLVNKLHNALGKYG